MQDNFIVKLNADEVQRYNTCRQDIDCFASYCEHLESEYGVKITVNNNEAIITAENTTAIPALIIDGHFSELSDDDLQVEYDKQHGLPEAIWGSWDW